MARCQSLWLYAHHCIHLYPSSLIACLPQTFKLRNGRRNNHGRGHIKFIRCPNCRKRCPKEEPRTPAALSRRACFYYYLVS
ncbi:hypothetical protein I3760_14G052900 [Carya illinoinensis]|uniref:40S ribosomal protein S26 n=1 Tax=Carya illinoinensis TaxID=32201 RepID=A0A8T1NJA5_CARIL|nr:hypothetical protein I3760_14G052900 [Carya illinoinensis]KAG6628983.1 hypothetical protein CIPAW_14G051300 [Carya illinoinensis]